MNIERMVSVCRSGVYPQGEAPPVPDMRLHVSIGDYQTLQVDSGCLAVMCAAVVGNAPLPGTRERLTRTRFAVHGDPESIRAMLRTTGFTLAQNLLNVLPAGKVVDLLVGFSAALGEGMREALRGERG